MKYLLYFLSLFLTANIAFADDTEILHFCESPMNVDQSIEVIVERDELQVTRLLIDGEDKGSVTLVPNVDEIRYKNDTFTLVVEGNNSKISIADSWSENLWCN